MGQTVSPVSVVKTQLNSVKPLQLRTQPSFGSTSLGSAGSSTQSSKPNLFVRIFRALYAPFGWVFDKIAKLFAMLAKPFTRNNASKEDRSGPIEDDQDGVTLESARHKNQALRKELEQQQKVTNDLDLIVQEHAQNLEVNQRAQAEHQALVDLLSSEHPETRQKLKGLQQKRINLLLKEVDKPLTHGVEPAWGLELGSTNEPEKIYNHVLPLPQPKSTPQTNLSAFVPPSLRAVEAGQGHFEIPNHGTIKPQKVLNAAINENNADIRNFLASKERGMPFLRSYGLNSLNWSEEKIARDLFQNFFDGHGHTLEGVKVDIDYDKKSQNYKIRVSGQGEFNHQEIEDLGAGNKSQDAYNAGGYGEGSKMFTLRLLSKYKVPKVTYASANWKLDYTMGNRHGEDTDRLYKSLEKVPYQHGNYVELETSDEGLVQAFLDATSFFYHPQNPDFMNPTFENKDWGYKLLGAQQPGNLYLANQRFEYAHSQKWHGGLEGITIFGKRKPQRDTLDYGRDRSVVSTYDLKCVLKNDYLDEMSNEALVQEMVNLSVFWSPLDEKQNAKYGPNEQPAGVALLRSIIDKLSEDKTERGVKVEFPPKMLALPDSSYELSQEDIVGLVKQGYQLCEPSFSKLGMPLAKEQIKKPSPRQLVGLQPTPEEIQKLNLLRYAANVLRQDQHSMALSKLFLPLVSYDDIQKPIYLCDRLDPNAVAMDDVYALAYCNPFITGELFGRHVPQALQYIWLDRNILKTGSFPQLLSIYLHELTHQYGSDHSADFSYRLTDWMESLNFSLIHNPQTRQKLHDAATLWRQITDKPISQ